jgi:hypothetical protein
MLRKKELEKKKKQPKINTKIFENSKIAKKK